MPTPRRDFLGWLGASTLLAAAGSHRLDAEPIRRAPHTPPVTDKWDMSWMDRIQGKYRAVFDSPDVGEGGALFRAVMWRNQHKAVFGTEMADASAVLVIRHMAIPLAMNDAYWDRFNIGKETKLKDSKGKWTRVNPIRVAGPDASAQYADYSLERLMAQGGIVLACNMAFQEVVYRFKKEDKLTREAAEARAKEHLIPGIILQPSGIFAALTAQEAGCHYILAS
jgi:hypothetical protein